MFCPQCRTSWPVGGNNGEVKVDKPKRIGSKSGSWGSPLICPDCQIPLAADRIKGEFPSVAHMSSTKEGSITIKDILRETASDNVIGEEIALDDKVREKKSRLFAAKVTDKNFITSFWKPSPTGSSTLIQRLAIIAFAVCISSIVFLSLHSMAPVREKLKMTTAAAALTQSVSTGLTSDQKAIVALMPSTVGAWSRNEQDSDLWQVPNGAGDVSRTTVSTYRDGSERVDFWAVKAPSMPNMSELQNFLGAARAIHTDSGVQYIKPLSEEVAGTNYLQFDYSPNRPSDAYTIVTNPFGSSSPHTISWYQAPYVITVGAQTANERDDFFRAIAHLPH